MQKPLSEMAKYIKKLIPVDIPETYSLKPFLKSVSTEKNIRKGVFAFRDFLYQLLDRLIDDGDLYHKPLKDGHSIEVRNYPFLNNVNNILINIGYQSILSKNGDSMLIENWQSLSVINEREHQLQKKITVKKIVECLKFLTSCGMCFEGIDLDAQKPDMSKDKLLKITYPDNTIMLTGMKVMAIAYKKLQTRTAGDEDILLRCDYKILKNEDIKIIDLLTDFIYPLPVKVQKFVLKLHQHCLDAGFTCKALIGVRTRFSYSYKSNVIWEFASSPLFDYCIFIKPKNTDKYSDVIGKFPIFLQQKIAKWYGCEKKRFGETCEQGCHGFKFSLDNSIFEISKDIEIWIDNEALFLRKK